MKKVLLTLACLVSLASFAGEHQTPTPVGTTTQQQQEQQSTSQVSITSCLANCGTGSDSTTTRDLGSEAAIALINGDTARAVAATTQTIRNTPSVSAPALVSSNDTCMGSTSGSANAPGIGLSFGTSWVDSNCRMLKNSRELWNMGMKAASLALMCNDADNKEALELTGFVCPTRENTKKTSVAVAAPAKTEQYTDPIVRARLGLPPLK